MMNFVNTTEVIFLIGMAVIVIIGILALYALVAFYQDEGDQITENNSKTD